MKSIYALLVSALLAAPAIAQPVVTAFSYQAYVDAPRADRLDFAAYAVERADERRGLVVEFTGLNLGGSFTEEERIAAEPQRGPQGVADDDSDDRTHG